MIVVATSVPNQEDAEKISSSLVAERLAACVHVLAPHVAIYEWKGEMCREQKVTILVKTDDYLYPAVESRIKDLHPHEIPLIFSVRPESVSPAYDAWVKLQTGRF